MDREAELDRLYEAYAKTAVLAQVADGRRLVRGHGPPGAPLAVVGEAPGAEEDARGIPFCGESGQLLQEMFREAGLPWELCYVTNVLPWRPPGNRTPFPFEVIASYRRVEAEIDIIQHGLGQPLIVVTAGATAWRAVSQGDLDRFSEARGKWFSMVPRKGWLVLPVFHPAAILRAGDREGKLMRDETVAALRSARGDVNAA